MVEAVELVDELLAVAHAQHLLLGVLESRLYLLVQFVAVSDDDHARIVADILSDPLCQPHHDETLARALTLPDDAALFLGDALLGSLDGEVLVGARGLLDACVEDDEVVDKL